MSELEDVPVHYELRQVLTMKDGLAMLSLLVFLWLPPFIAFALISKYIFDLNPNIPLESQLHGIRYWLIPAVVLPALICVVILSKYIWLILMSRFLNRRHVGPLISWGIPRRISRLDQAILARFYPK